ncbi:MAG: hypothetical protein IJ002_03205 [Clostridia bacterium]|nr:hypothetical protein [Clostridia bacterium]MBQ8836500.1 hypothetical protein [Clostridia bacterium]
MDDQNKFDYSSLSEKRRNAVKSAERGFINVGSDKFRMNDVMLSALVVIAAVISFTDFSFSLRGVSNLTALTVFLYIITMYVYRNRYMKGISRGRQDEEYIRALENYRAKRKELDESELTGRVSEFCTYYKKKELREYRESLLCDIDMTYEEYREKYMRMSLRQLKKAGITYEGIRVIRKCNRAKAIKLYPGMILNENGEYDRQKLIGRSGRERERSDVKREAISRALYVIFGSVIVINVMFNFSFITVAQWIIRMLPVVIAIISGDDGGYCCITVTETNFKHGQVGIINLFNEWIKSRSQEMVDEEE